MFEVTFRQLGNANNAQQNSMEKLSSGLRINSAKDDAAGLAISEKMRGQIRGLDMAAKNSQDGISLLQTAEGALNETHDILQRMRELAVQGANDTNVTADRDAIQDELNQLMSEVDRIAGTTEFNTKNLLSSASGFSATLQVGANVSQTISIQISSMNTTGLSLTTSNISVGDNSKANTAISTIDDAIKSVSTQRSKLGAYQNRLEHTINNLSTSSENLTAAESRIRDVDMAKEMMEQTKASILSQASQAMLAQANQQPQGVLQLLR